MISSSTYEEEIKARWGVGENSWEFSLIVNIKGYSNIANWRGSYRGFY